MHIFIELCVVLLVLVVNECLCRTLSAIEMRKWTVIRPSRFHRPGECSRSSKVGILENRKIARRIAFFMNSCWIFARLLNLSKYSYVILFRRFRSSQQLFLRYLGSHFPLFVAVLLPWHFPWSAAHLAFQNWEIHHEVSNISSKYRKKNLKKLLFTTIFKIFFEVDFAFLCSSLPFFISP